jgi:hypothetical protein
VSEPSRSAQIAHVLFLDLVGYSRRSVSGQRQLVEELNAAVAASPAFDAARALDAVQIFPSGDGMALAFYHDMTAPARCAVEVARRLCGEGQPPVRMGIHSGLVQGQLDLAGRQNLVGEGLNTAQRVMDFGEAGHILLSGQYAAWLGELDEWTAAIHPAGEGTAKHGLKLRVFSLWGPDFGRAEIPPRLASAGVETALSGPSAEPPAAPAAQGAPRVGLLYRPNLSPDAEVLHTLETRLREAGYQVFVDHEPKITAAWARKIEEPIRGADAVIAIVSPRSMQSEMLEFELETAHDQQLRTGTPAILPVVIGAAEELDGALAAILRPMPLFVWSGPQDDPKLVAEILSAVAEPLKPRSEEVRLEPVGGAVPPDSPFYVRRRSDVELFRALEAGESLVLVKGARQVGKTSMLGQGTKHSRELGRRQAMTDFQKFNAAQLSDEDGFYRLLAATLGRQLGFRYDWEAEWDPVFGPNLNLETFLRALLEAAPEPLVWFMDEVDKLFTAPFASDFFGLVRSWHNSRSTEPDGPWTRLTVVIAYATEAHLFIQDLNQSPFNVGRRLELEDFNLQQTVDLNARYGGPLHSYGECELLQELLAGQPFLTRRALDLLATGKYDLEGLLDDAATEKGPFDDHLQRMLVAVSRLPEVTAYAREVLAGANPPPSEAHYRLLAAGVIKASREGVGFRCPLYRRYLQAHL